MTDASESTRFRRALGVPYIAYQAIFCVGPLVLLAATSLLSYRAGQPRYDPNLQNYFSVLSNTEFLRCLIRSVGLAVLVSVSSIALALPAVLGVTAIPQARIGRKLMLLSGVMFFAGVIPRLYAFEFVLSEHGPLFGLWPLLPIRADSGLLYSQFGVYLSYFPLTLPLCLIVLLVARQSVPNPLIDASYDLGASWLRTQTSVIIPLMRPGVIVALLLSFILTIGDVVVVDMIGGSQVYTTPLFILDYVKIDDWGTAAAAGLILLLVALAAMVVSARAIMPEPER